MQVEQLQKKNRKPEKSLIEIGPTFLLQFIFVSFYAIYVKFST